jgi:chemotaxis protein MotB
MANAKGELPPIIIVKKKVAGHGHHGGAWKVAYADFVTAMMAFFMVMWLVVTMPQEVLGGIADYFKSPSAVEGQAATMSPGMMGPGGAGDAPIAIFDKVSPKTGKGEDGDGRKANAEEVKKLAEELERQRLEELARQLQEAIRASQALAPYKDQLLIDITPEGLRIQVVDEQNRPMFDSGSFRLQSYTNAILDELAEYLDSVPNRVAITGHTDVTPFSNGDAGYTNWELSADRANAARRSLINGGLAPDKFARVVGLADTALFDKTNPSNPVNRRISIILLTQAAEDKAREYDEFKGGDAAADGRGTAPDAPATADDAVADPPSSAPQAPEPERPATDGASLDQARAAAAAAERAAGGRPAG